MTTKNMYEALEIVLQNKTLRKELDIDKQLAYDLRNRKPIGYVLEVLFKAGKLKLVE